jgi:hypothetical protein
MTAPGRAPGAITGYDNMPGYAASAAMYLELRTVARRIRDSDYGLDRTLAERSLRTLLATAEAGARLAPGRRMQFYRAAWLATHDCDGILRSAAKLHRIRPELLMGAHAMVRQTQQAVTIAAGVMARRKRRDEPAV